MAQVNPQADALASGFNDAYQKTLPAADALGSLHVDDHQCEPLLQCLRDGLTAMEGYTEQMVNMLYEVDVYMAPSAAQLAAGFNPQEALSHISDLFHSYQAELLSKREALADYTCEDITPSMFSAAWHTLDEVQQGRKQEMDDLADLLANIG